MSAYFDWWERRALLLEGDRLIVGSASDSDVVVGDASVSRIRAVLHQLNGRWFIEDCGSRNGTAVNSQPLTSMCPLRSHDEVRFGRARLVFCGQPSAGGTPIDTASEDAVKLHLANLTAKFGVVGAERRRSRLANAALDTGAVTLAELRDR